MDTSSTKFLFVYGTLRRGYQHAMAKWLAEQAGHVGKARMPGRLYRLGSYPGAVQINSAESWIIGDVFYLKKPLKVLEKLDRYEGCTRGQSLNPLFVRQEIDVYLDDATLLSAWVYLYNREVSGFPQIPGGDYLALPGLARARYADK